MSQIQIHRIGDHVYVRDELYEWLPAVVDDVQEHEVLVRIVLPKDWRNTTIRHDTTKHDNGDEDDEKYISNKQKVADLLEDEQRWEKLVDYFNHHLPFQNRDDDNVDDTSAADENHTMNVCNDMSQLRNINEAELLYQIKKRHCSMDQPYTRITTSPSNTTSNSSSSRSDVTTTMLVAVNPCRYIPSLYTMEKQQYYIQHYKKQQQSLNSYVSSNVTEDIHAPSFDEKKEEDQTSSASHECAFTSSPTITSDRVECEPHIYEISSLAYHGLISTSYNQTILVSGESGSGKTESIKIVLNHLASLTPTINMTGTSPQSQQQHQQFIRNCNDDDLVSLILASSPIFEAFGNAKTFRNANSSRFGKVTKLHYITSSSSSSQSVTSAAASIPIASSVSGGACLIGSSFQTYMLEANRVVSHVEGERNYHIFYQMLSAPSPVKNELLGPDWRETTPADFRYLNRHSCGIRDNMIDASNWTYTLKALIVFGWDGDSLESLIRALGIILLVGNIEFGGNDENKASITQPADLIMLSTSLGIHAAELELALTQRTIQTTHDLLLVPFTPDQANEACEALSKTIYTRIFESIVKQINSLTTASCSAVATTKTLSLVDIFGFETFDVNRFEQFCINYANERLQQKYILDSFSRHKTEYEEEGITLPEWKNIDNSTTVELFESVPGLIQSLNDQCILPNGSSEDFVSIVKQLHRSHEHFKYDKLQTKSEFCVHHFAGPVLYDASKFVERNADKLPDFLISVVATSSNGLIAKELNDMMQERLSTSGSTKKLHKRSVVDIFQFQLKKLLLSIDASQSRYIRCIKPCDDLDVYKRMDHCVVLRQLKCSGLVTAVEQSRNVFPDKLSFENIANRYCCLLSSAAMSSIEDMDLIDKAQVILSSIYAPIIEQYNGSEFAMPFICGHTKVFFRAGAVGILEKQRYSLHLRCALKIQCVVRSFIAKRRAIRSILAFTLLQSIYRGHKIQSQFKLFRESVVMLQTRERAVSNRSKFLKVKASILLVQKWWIRAKVQLEIRRTVTRMKTMSALKINRWLYRFILNERQRTQSESILRITAWLRYRNQRKSFLSSKCSATTIAAWFRATKTWKQYHKYKEAAATISRHHKFQLQVRINRERRLEESMLRQSFNRRVSAIRKLQSFFRSKLKYKSKKFMAIDEFATSDRAVGKSLPVQNSNIVERSRASLRKRSDELLLSTPHSMFEQLEIYRRQITDLKSDITLLTSEAELHKQEVEAEFEDRLAEYENEVLQLKQTVAVLKNEKITLKDELAANIENVQNLKRGIQSMHEAHREYLNKVMRAVENANREHQNALELVQQDKEKQIKELSDVVDRLQNERRDFSERNTDTNNNTERIYHLARKIEKITAPDYVVAIAKKVRKVNLKEEYIEEKFSGRIRQLLYKLEDVAAFNPCNDTCEEEYLISLQQQLISAKAEIERLKDSITNSPGNEVSVGRLGLKKFFER